MLYANVNDTKANLSKYLSMIEKDDETVVICRNNHPVAQVTKFAAPKKKQKITLGLMKGKLDVSDDFDAPLPDSIMKHFS